MWEDILKASLSKKHFRDLKRIVYETVETYGQGIVFHPSDTDFQEKFFSIFENDAELKSKADPRAIAYWKSRFAQDWLKSVGSKIISNHPKVKIEGRRDNQSRLRDAYVLA